MSVLSINRKNFNQEILASEVPVLIDFWAPWCGPCRMFSPVIDELAEDYAGKAKIVKVNIDEEPELAQAFGVMSIPTLVLVKDGEAVSSSVGLKPKYVVEEMLELN